MSHAEEPPGAPAATRIPAPRAREVASRVHGEPAVSEEGTPYEGLVTRALAFAVDAAVINLVAAGVAVVVDWPCRSSRFPTAFRTCWWDWAPWPGSCGRSPTS